MRLDLFLFKNGFASSRSQANQIIENGVIFRNKTITKSSYDVPDDASINEITILNPMKYVSRGGYKLEHAIEHFQIDFTNLTILDIGSSTGGFTDCALKHGALKVYCVDVGTSQLSQVLKEDKIHVYPMENTDIRTLKSDSFGFKFDCITSDLSFISQTW